ncbi:MAG: spore coat U domain-containing protein [Candidatus Dasytiphilus stammeri]
MKKILSVILAILLSTSVYALTVKGQLENNLNVQMIIGNGCEITGGSLLNLGNLDFGEHPNIKNKIDAHSNGSAGKLGINCTKGVNYSIALNNGLQPDGTKRRMMKVETEAREFIKYDLYQDSARTTLWDTHNLLKGIGNGKETPIIIYGRVPPQSTPSSGAYHDTVTVIVSW